MKPAPCSDLPESVSRSGEVLSQLAGDGAGVDAAEEHSQSGSDHVGNLPGRVVRPLWLWLVVGAGRRHGGPR